MRRFLPATESSEDQETERREHHNDPDVGYQPLRDVVPEEQDVHADHDGYQREHVQHNAYLSCHTSFYTTGWARAMAKGHKCARPGAVRAAVWMRRLRA
jgi:hypothetical protein